MTIFVFVCKQGLLYSDPFCLPDPQCWFKPTYWLIWQTMLTELLTCWLPAGLIRLSGVWWRKVWYSGVWWWYSWSPEAGAPCPTGSSSSGSRTTRRPFRGNRYTQFTWQNLCIFSSMEKYCEMTHLCIFYPCKKIWNCLIFFIFVYGN